MKFEKLIPNRNSLAAQLLRVVFFVYIIVMLIVVMVRVCVEFNHTKSALEDELVVLAETFEPSLARAMWDMNLEQVQPTFLGLVESPSVVGMLLKNEEGVIVGCAGTVIDDGLPVTVRTQGGKARVSGYVGLFEHEFSITHEQDNRNIKVGQAVIYSSSRVVFDQMKLGVMLAVGSAFIQTLVLWFLILWISSRIVSRPLSALTEATREITLDRIDDIEISLDIKGQNELKVLEESFNSMLLNLKKSRNELSQRNQQFKAVVEGTPSVIFVKDAAGRYLFVNPRYEDLFHVQMTEITGQTDHDIFPKEMADAFRQNDLEVIRKRKSMEVEEKAPQDDGVHTYLSVKYPLFDRAGKVTAVCGIGTDITALKLSETVLKDYNATLEKEVHAQTQELVKEIEERKSRSLELRKLNTALDQTANPVVITTMEGEIEYVNQAFAARSGYTRDELIGNNPRVLKSGRHEEEFYREMWSTIAQGKNWTGDIYNRSKDGDMYWEHMSISPIKGEDGTIINYISVREDITRQKALDGLVS